MPLKSCLLLGLDGAGKTLLLRQLQARLARSHHTPSDRAINFLRTGSCLMPLSVRDNQSDHDGVLVNPETQPTIGVEHTQLQVDVKVLSVCEIGGQLIPMWPAYFSTCDFWIYLVDVSSPAQVIGAAVELFNILRVEPMRRKPTLVILNKMDHPSAMDDDTLQSYLALDELIEHDGGGVFTVVKVSARTGRNVDTVVRWLAQRWSSSTSVALTSRVKAQSERGNASASRGAADGNRVHPTA